MSFIKGLKNITKPTLVNFIIIIILVIIIMLVYLNEKKVDLFNPTIGIIDTSLSKTNSYGDTIANFITNLKQKQEQKTIYQEYLTTQNEKIKNLSNKVSELINTSS
jgi:cell shape-determining protein MreC